MSSVGSKNIAGFAKLVMEIFLFLLFSRAKACMLSPKEKADLT